MLGLHPSHSQLLLRSDGSADTTRIDMLFKAVDVMKVRSHYNGLRIRCATLTEQEQIQGETPEITYIDPASDKFDQGSRYFVLEASDGFDYVVADAVGWHEDHALGEPSYYADPSGGTAPWSQTPKPRWAQTTLDGVNGGLGTPMATIGEFATAIASAIAKNIPTEDRTRYRYIYVIIGQALVPDPHAFGAFLTRSEAEQQQQQLADRFPEKTFAIDAVPIGM
ncbi:hypothetical protein [Amycolatopsis magusensis]|uniref:hypothetical protein n=1 Tax=Amycolatopsis magusensis TaxID=882444 RepID=UPI0037B45D67